MDSSAMNYNPNAKVQRLGSECDYEQTVVIEQTNYGGEPQCGYPEQMC